MRKRKRRDAHTREIPTKTERYMKTALKSEENREEKREAMKSIEKIYIHEDPQREKEKTHDGD